MRVLEVAEGIRGLIFDCDGTLADTMPYHIEAWQQAFATVGETIPVDYLDGLKGMPELKIVELINQQFDLDLQPEATVAAKHTVLKSLLKNVQPIVPVTGLAERYRGILPMAVASGSTLENVSTILERIRLADLFDVVITADDDIEHKPSPQLFLEAARRLDVEPGTCQVFEDGEIGLEAARRAGMTATDIRPFID